MKRFVDHYLFSEELSQDARTLNAVVFLGLLAFSACFIARVIERVPLPGLIMIALGAVAMALLFFIANHYNAHMGATWFVLILLSDVFFPLGFFFSGGAHSGMLVYFVLTFLSVFLFSRGLTSVVLGMAHIVVIVACYVTVYLHPEWFYQLTPLQQLIDQVSALLIVSLFVGFSFKYQMKISTDEKLKAQAASRTKSDFLSTMSHEIRTPMNAIIGMTAIGKTSAAIDRKNYAFERIDDASHHLLGVINDILDMSKIEANKLELSVIEFRFEKMLQKVQTVISPKIEEKHQSFTITVDERIPAFLISDDQRLVQVIINLLSNAAKFTPEQGAIALNALLLDENDGFCTIQVEVSDTGIGLSEEQMRRLFGSFVQAESGTSRKYGGSGLGLVISKNIVELLGGTIWVESELDKGSRFSFTFLAQVGTGASENDNFALLGEEELADLSFKGKRILLAEDIEVNQEVIVALLESTDIRIDCAKNGLEAFNLFSASPQSYDLILMDIMMPEMDGYEATRKIRALDVPRAKEIPIIAMTANVFRDDIEKCLASGMGDHIGKPIDHHRLLVILRENL